MSNTFYGMQDVVEVFLGDNAVIIFRRDSHKTPFWLARFRVKGEKKYIYRSTKTTNLEQAKEVAREIYLELLLKNKHGIQLFSRTVSQIIDEFLRHEESLVGVGKRSAHMLRNNTNGLKYWKEYCGGHQITSISDGVIDGYLKFRLSYWKDKEDKPATAKLVPSDRTLEWEYDAFGRLLKWAKKKKYIEEVPDVKYEPKKLNRRPALTMDQWVKLSTYINGEYLSIKDSRVNVIRQFMRAYVWTLLKTGIRVGEARYLKWQDLEPVKLEKGITFLITVAGKTGQREVVAKPIVFNRLMYWRRIRQRNGWPCADADYIFADENGKPYRDVREGFNTLIRKAGVEFANNGDKITIYSLRHSYGTFYLRYNTNPDIFLLAKNMGTSIEMLQDYYRQMRTRDAVEKLI